MMTATNTNRKRVFVDMDQVLCAYDDAFKRDFSKENPYPQSKENFFLNLEPMPGAIASFKKLQESFDVWILTSPSVRNPLCYSEKRLWVEKHLGSDVCNKLIISPDKTLLMGDYLIDDMRHDGFIGEHIHFGTKKFPDWKEVVGYLKEEKKTQIERIEIPEKKNTIQKSKQISQLEI